MPIPAIVALAGPTASSATAIASQAASPFAQLLSKTVQSANAMAPPTALSAQSTSQQLAANALNNFNSQLQQFLSAEGVNTAQPIVLRSDGQGGVELANNHPDASKIRAILAENPDLAAQFASVQQAYVPMQPISANSQSAPPTFNITITGQQAQASFS